VIVLKENLSILPQHLEIRIYQNQQKDPMAQLFVSLNLSKSKLKSEVNCSKKVSVDKTKI